MNNNQLFQQTRWRLTTWYAGILGMILSLCGFGGYEAVAHAHRITINQELKTVAGTLHDSLQPVLQQPGEVTTAATRLLPDACILTMHKCLAPTQTPLQGALQQGKYYLRLFSPSGRLVAVAGVKPHGLPVTPPLLTPPNPPLSRGGNIGSLPLPRGGLGWGFSGFRKHSTSPTEEEWQTLTDNNGIRYRQVFLILHTENGQKWGYLQVGRNLEDFDNYVATVKWILLLGLPIIVILVIISSWWLAQRAMQPIYYSYRQIQQFTADAAHELRTPLAATQATVESTLMLPTLDETLARETLQTLKRQNKRLTHLVADLLMLARMDRQLTTKGKIKGKIKGEIVCLNDIISDVAEELAALALASDITLTADIKVSQSLNVLGDVEQLYRLVYNLVSNGIQYTSFGGKVTLILTQENNEAVIQVKDTGIGISPEDIKLIFDRFYRVNKARSRDKGGSGLGLSIAQAIALTHQGKIEVKSDLNKGSIFTVKLPLLT